MQAMKNASSESTIKGAVLNELRQEKKQKSRNQNATNRKVQVNLKRLPNDEHQAFGAIVMVAPNITGAFPKR